MQPQSERSVCNALTGYGVLVFQTSSKILIQQLKLAYYTVSTPDSNKPFFSDPYLCVPKPDGLIRILLALHLLVQVPQLKHKQASLKRTLEAQAGTVRVSGTM
jgi:hypothetical protein